MDRRNSLRQEKLSRQHRRCFFCLSLSTGVKLVILADVVLLLVIVLGVMSAAFILALMGILDIYIKPLQYSIYFLFTSGFIAAILAVKCYYGLRYIWKTTARYRSKVSKESASILPPKRLSINWVNVERSENNNKDDKLIVKRQRKDLHSFFIVSTVFYIYILIVSVSHVPIVVVAAREVTGIKFFSLSNKSLSLLFTFAFIGIFSLTYLIKRILWHLEEKDEELRDRSIKETGSFILTTGGYLVTPDSKNDRTTSIESDKHYNLNASSNSSSSLLKPNQGRPGSIQFSED